MKESSEISEIHTEERCLSPQTAAVLSQPEQSFLHQWTGKHTETSEIQPCHSHHHLKIMQIWMEIFCNVNQNFSDKKANESLWHWEVQKQMQGFVFYSVSISNIFTFK